MNKPRLAVVVTTIGDGAFLEEYCRVASIYEWTDNLTFIVIPDRKTPKELYARCQRLSAQGFKVQCPDLTEQETFLKRIGNMNALIPYDSDNRRNVGFLLALGEGVDGVISIDDDNLPVGDTDMFFEHAIVCSGSRQATVLRTSTGWFNACTLLELDSDAPVFPRGYPLRQRHNPAVFSSATKLVTITINMGLWLGAPDLDAITWLSSPCTSTGMKNTSVILDDSVWAPINTQNTAVRADAIAAFYFIPMGSTWNGIRFDRYGDIFSGYFAEACSKALGYFVRIGTPVATHARNKHDYITDMVKELPCIIVLEDLLEWLTSDVRLEGDQYSEAYLSLSHQLEDRVEQFRGSVWTIDMKNYFHRVAYCMRQWVDACKIIGGL